ncbi:MAG: ABC transporter permease [Bacteroidetes bacterium]|nr:MAG: ABC transporter permease [Bacteroidota bacterium]
MLNILEYALISLARRWQKQFALIFIYALVVAFYASVVLFTNSLRTETKAVLQHIPELWIQKIKGGRLHPLPISLIDSLKNYRGISQITGRIWGYVFDATSGAVFTVMGSDSSFRDLGLIKTNFEGKLDSNSVLVGQGILEVRQLRIGDYLTLSEVEGEIQKFKIVGIFTAESDMISNDLLILSSNSARKIISLPENEFTDIAIRLRNSDETDNIGKKIDEQFEGIRVVSKTQLQATYETLFSWRGGILMYGAFLALFAFLILAWERAAGLNHEEKKEIGILKGLGWQISDILLLKGFEGIAISLTSTLLGIILGYIHIFVFDAPLLKPLLVGWSVLYPNYALLPALDFESLLMIACLSIIPYLSATLIPAWRGAIIDPSEMIRE